MKRKRRMFICAVTAVFLVTLLGINPADAIQNMQKQNDGIMRETAGAPQVTDGKTKDEVVYATLSSTGAVDSVYVVNHFETDTAGEIVDYGDYSAVQNLTDTGAVSQNGDKVAFTTDERNFYYQGNLNTTDLPWVFDITYSLDGVETAPQDMAGKTGHMALHITSQPNGAVDPTFYDNYMLQITVTLDTAKCANIDAPKGTVAEAGSSKMIAYTVMPEKNADYMLQADVSNFSMAGIQISGVPYAMDVEIPETDEQFEDLEKLPDAISELNDGVGELADGTSELESGANKLVSGSDSIESGLSQLSANSSQLVDGSSQINDALSQIATSLNDGSLDIDLSQMEELPDGLDQLAEALEQVSSGLSQLNDGFSTAYSALDSAIQGIPEPAVAEAQIQSLYGIVMAAGDPELTGALDQLVANYTAAQTVKGTYAQVKEAFDAVCTTIDSLTPGIDEMAKTLETIADEVREAMKGLDGLDRLSELATGMQELSSSYSTFHSGLLSYTGGVNTLASNYGTFNAGLAKFSDGVGELNSGVDELYDGTTTLNDEVADLPDMLQEEIDKMKDQYLPADFDAVSFTSPKNTDTGYVQFVMQCDGIDAPDQAEKTPDEAQPESVWDRFTALFTGTAE